MPLREEFVQHVADAYEHLYDVVYLRTHPLVALLALDRDKTGKERARGLHQLLVEVVEELDPGSQAPVLSKEWRRYRLLVLRYIDGLEAPAIAERLAISRRTYYRDQSEAIAAAAEVLWEKRNPDPEAGASDRTVGEATASARIELLRLEAARWVRQHEQAPLLETVVDAANLVAQLAEARGVRTEIDSRDMDVFVPRDRGTMRQILLGALSYVLVSCECDEIVIRVEPTAEGGVLALDAHHVVRSIAPDNGETGLRFSMLQELGRTQGITVEKSAEACAALGLRLYLPCAPRPTILVADDNEDVLHLFSRYLSQSGYKAIMAHSGREALDLALRFKPSAIILDLMMPERDGWDTLQTFTNHPEIREIPIIICTVLNAKELALSLGASCFLSKPVSAQELLSALRTVGVA